MVAVRSAFGTAPTQRYTTATIAVVYVGRANWRTAALALLIGAGLGGLLGLEAQAAGSPLFGLPVVIGIALLLRAKWQHLTRHWADLAAFLLGAGALALVFAIPATLNPMCIGSGDGATGPTDCTINYYALGVAALYAACLVTGAALVARLTRYSGPRSALGARSSRRTI